MYALFVYDPMLNLTTFVVSHSKKEALIIWANQKFKDNLMFAIYKFVSETQLFGSRIPATKWALDTKFAGKAVPPPISYYTAFETVYKIDDGEWYFTSI
tara:strand:- start:291 stop:587 length:297 start_codon:yes stop_codon:yes gene_type:complete